MTTLNQVKKKIQEIAETHGQLNHFYFGELDEWVDAMQKDRGSYPSLCLVLKDSTVQNGMSLYNFTIWIAGLGKSESEDYSDTALIMEDIFSELNNPSIEWFPETPTLIVQYFNARKTEHNTSGCFADFSVGVKFVKNRYLNLTDNDVAVFATAIEDQGGSLPLPQKRALVYLVKDFRAAGAWDKMHAVYPFVGGTADTHKWNLKDPRDLDAAYRMLFVGSPTHSANGVSFNGTTQYANTKLIPSGSQLQRNSTSFGVYLRSVGSSGTQGVFGMENPPNTQILWSGNNLLIDVNSSPSVTFAAPPTSGLWAASRTELTVTKKYKNGVLIHTDATASAALPVLELFLGAINVGGSPTYPTAMQAAFLFIGDGLTDAEMSAVNEAIAAFQERLGRAV